MMILPHIDDPSPPQEIRNRIMECSNSSVTISVTWVAPNDSRVDFYHYQLQIVDDMNNTLMDVSNTTEDIMVVFPGLHIPHNVNISFILSAHNCNGASVQLISNIGKTSIMP